MQNFIKLGAVVHELSCWQSLNAENNTAGSKNSARIL